MEDFYKFDCGCKWPILEPSKNSKMPKLKIDLHNLPYCDLAWKIFANGDTKGVFQLESHLGKQWAKKLKPKNMEHLAALGALLRPGCLNSLDENNISMTEHYCKRVNGMESVPSYHPAIDKILASTYGALVFQEQAMEIAQVAAGFNLQEADILRKAIGKKNTQEMANCKKMFIDGAKRVEVVSEQQAEELFGWIEASQRYSFNKSHSSAYAYTGYDTAYLKSHFPVYFFTSWLYYAKDKADSAEEVANLIDNAKLYNINVFAPDIRKFKSNFHTDGESIWFGLSDIKGIGSSQINKLIACFNNNGNKIDNWINFLIDFSDSISSSSISKIIAVGGFDWCGESRQKLISELEIWVQLTEKEKGWIKENKKENSSLKDYIFALANPKKEGGGCNNKNRVALVSDLFKMLDNPPTSYTDTISWKVWSEREYLGVALSCYLVDESEIQSSNTTCKEFYFGKTGFMMLSVEVLDVKEIVTKKGKDPGRKMARVVVEDSTCKIDNAIMFPEAYEEFSHKMFKGNIVSIRVDRDKKTDSMIIKEVKQI